MNYRIPNQSDEILIGNRDIARYCGISLGTVSNWRNKHEFPVASMPDGRLMTTKPLITEWILSRMGAVTPYNQSPGRPRKTTTKYQAVTGEGETKES